MAGLSNLPLSNQLANLNLNNLPLALSYSTEKSLQVYSVIPSNIQYFYVNCKDLIRGIRSHERDKEKYISSCLNQIRSQIAKSDPDTKAALVAKLCYVIAFPQKLHMMGYDMNWASFYILEVMSSSKMAHKRTAYAAAAQCFRQDTPVLMLTTNQLKKDLSSNVFFECAQALHGLGHFVSPDLARDLLPDLTRLLNHSRPYIRKRAVLVLYRFFLKYPESLRIAFPNLKSKLEDVDPAVVSAVVNVVCELARKNPKSYLPLAPVLYGLLTTSSNNWMLIKIVKLFAALTPLEPRLVKKLIPPITKLMQSTTAMSVLYECIQTSIVGGLIGSEDTQDAENGDKSSEQSLILARLCVDKLRLLVEDSDQNLKYLGLYALSKLQPLYPRAALTYKETVIRILSDPDISIRTRALSLISGMVSQKTLVDVTRRLLVHINLIDPSSSQTALKEIFSFDEEYVSTVIEKIIEICSHDTFSRIRDFDWYLSVLELLSTRASGEVAALCGDQIREIAIRVQEVRKVAVDVSISILSSAKNEVCEGCAWVCGEYPSLLNDPINVVNLLLSDEMPTSISTHSARTRITAALKIVSRHAEVVASNQAQIIGLLEKIQSFPEIEIADRAVESGALLNLMFLGSATPKFSDQVVVEEISVNGSALAEIRKFWETPMNPVAANAQRMVPVPVGLNLDSAIYDDFEEDEEDGTEGTESFAEVIVEQQISEDDAKKRKQARKEMLKNDPFYINDPIKDMIESVDEALEFIPIEEISESEMKAIKKKSKSVRKPTTKSTFSVNRDSEVPEGISLIIATSSRNTGELDPETLAIQSVDLTVEPEEVVVRKPKTVKKSDATEKKKKKKDDTTAKKKKKKEKETTKSKEPETQLSPYSKQLLKTDEIEVSWSWDFNKSSDKFTHDIILQLKPGLGISGAETYFDSERSSLVQWEKNEYRTVFDSAEIQRVVVPVTVLRNWDNGIDPISVSGHVNLFLGTTLADTQHEFTFTLPSSVFFKPPHTLSTTSQDFTQTLQSSAGNLTPLISEFISFSITPTKLADADLFIRFLCEKVMRMKVIEIIGPAASIWGECEDFGWIAGLVKINGDEVGVEIKGVSGKFVAAAVGEVQAWVTKPDVQSSVAAPATPRSRTSTSCHPTSAPDKPDVLMEDAPQTTSTPEIQTNHDTESLAPDLPNETEQLLNKLKAKHPRKYLLELLLNQQDSNYPNAIGERILQDRSDLFAQLSDEFFKKDDGNAPSDRTLLACSLKFLDIMIEKFNHLLDTTETLKETFTIMKAVKEKMDAHKPPECTS
ncbi:AP-3 complex subunit delta-1, partial [Nowakowskiella sp. JEL0407]